MDVKIICLNKNLKYIYIYIYQFKGFEENEKGKGNLGCKLKKSINELKQTS